MCVQKGVFSYSPRCLSVCPSVATKMTVGLFPAQFSNTPNKRMPPPNCPWATRPIHARCPKRLPSVLGVEGSEGLCSKSKLFITHSHHHRRRRRRCRHYLFLQLLLKVLIVARAFFKQQNPGAVEDGAENGAYLFHRHLLAQNPRAPTLALR